MSTVETDRAAWEAAESTRIEAAEAEAEEYCVAVATIRSEWLEAQRSDDFVTHKTPTEQTPPCHQN